MWIILSLSIGAFGIAIGAASAYRLSRWERLLRRSRIVVAYKGRVKMNRPLLDWLVWARSADKDKQTTGHAIYKMGGTTIAVLEPVAKDHGKAVTKDRS